MHQNLQNEDVDVTDTGDVDLIFTPAHKDSGITELHRKVFEKVWAEVDRIVVELRGVLFKMLEDPWCPIEDQEKTIKQVPMQLLIESNFHV